MVYTAPLIKYHFKHDNRHRHQWHLYTWAEKALRFNIERGGPPALWTVDTSSNTVVFYFLICTMLLVLCKGFTQHTTETEVPVTQCCWAGLFKGTACKVCITSWRTDRFPNQVLHSFFTYYQSETNLTWSWLIIAALSSSLLHWL